MAKALLGPMVTDLRGKQGDVVFCRGLTGPYTRALFTPPNPQTDQQQQWRGWMGSAWESWYGEIEQSDRDAWNAAARAFARTNKVGNKIKVSGQQYMIKFFMNAASAWNPIPSAPTQPNPPPDPGQLSAFADSGLGLLTVTPTNPLPDDCTAIINATKELSPGVTNFNTFLRQLVPTVLPRVYWPLGAGTPPPPFTASPTYNALDWTTIGTVQTFTPTIGQQDEYLSYSGNWQNIGGSCALPDVTQDHWLFSMRLDTTTGEAYLFGFTATPTPSTAIAYRATWTATPTILATSPIPAMDTGNHQWDCNATAGVLSINTDVGGYFGVTDTTLRDGYSGLCPSNGPVIYTSGYVDAQSVPYPVPPDITLQWTTKFGVLVPGQSIGLTMRYLRGTTAEISPAQSILIPVS